MSFLAGLYDPVEGRLYEAEPGRFVGDTSPPTGLSAVYDYEALRESLESFDFLSEGSTISRFLPLLPLRQGISIPSADLSTSPLREQSVELDGRTVRVRHKDEGHHPGGTIWDRGAVVALSVAREWSRTNLVLPSDGPVSRCVNFYAGKAGLSVYVLLEEPGERIDASFEDATAVHWESPEDRTTAREVLELAGKYELYPAVPGWNPYFVEGLKTVAYELAEQSETLPDVVYACTESRLVVHAAQKGFRELSTLGRYDTTPEVVQVRLPGSQNPDRSTRNRDLPEELSPREPQIRQLTPSEEDLVKVPESVPRFLRFGLAGSTIDDRYDPHDGDVTVLTPGTTGDEDRSLQPEPLELDGPAESLPDDYLGANEERSS